MDSPLKENVTMYKSEKETKYESEIFFNVR